MPAPVGLSARVALPPMRTRFGGVGMTNLARAFLDAIAEDAAAVERLRALVGTPQGPEPWVGVDDAAEHLGCKRQRVYDLVYRRAIPHRKDGSRLLFRLSDLDAWLSD